MNAARRLVFVMAAAAVLGWASPLAGQSRAELERRRQQLTKRIEATRRLIQRTNREYRQTTAYLRLLNRQIHDRQRLIHTLRQELAFLNERIEAKEKIIRALQRDLQHLLQEYQRLLVHTYQLKRQYLPLQFILDSEGLRDAARRLKLLQFYEEHRRQQLRLIRQTEATLRREMERLTEQHHQKQALLRQLRQEEAALLRQIEERERLRRRLAGEKNRLLRQLAEQRREAKRLDEAIREAIRRELAARRKKPLTGKEKELSEAFARQKRKLPWPVRRGVLLRSFGTHPHPVIRNVKIQNNGIDIRTYADEPVRAVADGVVSRIVILPTGSKAVLVRHGNYYTVYSNLREAKVKAGQTVVQGDVVGFVRKGRYSNVPELHFEVWEGVKRHNPITWLRPR